MSQLQCERCQSYIPGHHHDVACPRSLPDALDDSEIAAFVEQAIKEADADARRARWRLGLAFFLVAVAAWCMGACAGLQQVCS